MRNQIRVGSVIGCFLHAPPKSFQNWPLLSLTNQTTNGMKVLVVEDEQGLAEGITDYMVKEGYVCETADTFQKADEKIHLYNYDCIIVDLTLPDGNGFQLVETLKRLASTTGIIIISARNALEDKLRGLEIGSDDYLTKPFHLSELNARVKSLLRRRQFGGHIEIQFRQAQSLNLLVLLTFQQ